MATLTYVYSDSTAVLGPLATYAEPHCYDLCAEHAERLTAPRGWEIVRLAGRARGARALARRPAGARGRGPGGGATPGRTGRRGPAGPSRPGVELGRRGHLRVLRDPGRLGRPGAGMRARLSRWS